MADVEKLQTLAGILDYPDPDDPSKGTSEQQFQEWLKNLLSVVNSVVGVSLWQPSTSYIVGQVICSPNMHPNTVAKVTTAGTTAAAEPAWGDVDTTIADGTVTYKIMYRTLEAATDDDASTGTDTHMVITPAVLKVITQKLEESNETTSGNLKDLSDAVDTRNAEMQKSIDGVSSDLSAAKTDLENSISSVNNAGHGVVGGNVSNANAWWVKLGGTIPLIIQGGNGKASWYAFPIAAPNKVLSVVSRLTANDNASNHDYGYIYNLQKTGFSAANGDYSRSWVAFCY